ncbi:DNRLRE domain-containing protein [Domibacillus aminovorans]|uniref:DNRLRE domain-containing protein n=1 Tax=Domibacillus aminovorans TaxID=29332 RepID=UPI003D1BE511
MPVIKIDFLNSLNMDTFTDSYSPTVNYGANTQLGIGASSNGRKYRSLLKFGMNQIPNNVIIKSAKLTLTTSSSGGGNITPKAHKVLSSWVASTVLPDTLPTWNPAILGETLRPTTVTTAFDIDITSAVRDWVNGEENYGIILEDDSNSELFWVHSLEASATANRPFITVDYSMPKEDKTQVEIISSSSYTGQSNLKTHTIPMPATYNAGDTLLAYVAYNSSSAEVMPVPAGWTVISREKGYANNYLVILKRLADKTETSALLNFVNNTYLTAGITAYRNVLSVVDTGAIKVDSVASIFKIHNAITSLPSNSLLTLLTMISSTATQNQPADFTDRFYGYAAAVISLEVIDSYNHQKTSYSESQLTVNTASSYAGAMKSIYLVPVTNLKPTIDGTDGYLGAYDTPLVKPYTITENDAGDSVTIVEKLNGLTINTKSSNGANTFDLTSRWATLPYGDHIISIEVNDSFYPQIKSLRTWKFTKTVPAAGDLILSADALNDAVASIASIKQKIIDNTHLDANTRLSDIAENLGAFAHFSVNEVVPNESVLEITLTDVLFKPRFVLVYVKEAAAYSGSPVGYASGYMLYPVEGIPSFLQKSLFVSVNQTASRGETFVSDFKLEKGTAIVSITHKRASSISDKGGTIQDIILLG